MRNEIKNIDLVLPFWGGRGVKSIFFIFTQSQIFVNKEMSINKDINYQPIIYIYKIKK